jgi:hypothetical protein
MNETYKRMRRFAFFPQMYPFISMRVNNCVSCVKKNNHTPKSTHKLHCELLSYPGQRLYVDIVGPLTPTLYRGFQARYFVSIQCGFTRYLEVAVVPDFQTPTVIEAIIQEWVLRHGFFEVIHSDRGSNFTSHLMRETMKQLGVVQTFTPPYTPEGNRVERAHKTLGNLIRANNRTEAKNWPQKLAYARACYNASVNRVTGVSPHEAMYGSGMLYPIDVVFPTRKPVTETFSSHVINLRTKFSEMAQKMMANERTALVRREANDQGRKKPDIKVGDFVYYYCKRQNPDLSRKLTSVWNGPFQVRRIVSDSLLLLFPAGRWAANPRELISTFSRVRKVDRVQPLSILQPSRRNLVDMSDFEDASTAEVIAFEEALQRDHLRRYDTPNVPQPTGEQLEAQVQRETQLNQGPNGDNTEGQDPTPGMPRDPMAWENLQEEVDRPGLDVQEDTMQEMPVNISRGSGRGALPTQGHTEDRGAIPRPVELELRGAELPPYPPVPRGTVQPARVRMPGSENRGEFQSPSFRGVFKSEGAAPLPEVRFSEREASRPSARVEGMVRGALPPPRIPGAGPRGGSRGTNTPLIRPDRPSRTAAEHARDLISDLANPDRRRTSWHSRKN